MVDLRSHGGRLFALHDATFSLDDAPLLPQRNVLRTVDLGSQVHSGFLVCCPQWMMPITDLLYLSLSCQKGFDGSDRACVGEIRTHIAQSTHRL